MAERTIERAAAPAAGCTAPLGGKRRVQGAALQCQAAAPFFGIVIGARADTSRIVIRRYPLCAHHATRFAAKHGLELPDA